jgi:DNA-directed RNA polymerase specialized sigma24 family protein
MLESLKGLGKPVDDRVIDPKIDKFFKANAKGVSIKGMEWEDVYQEIVIRWLTALPNFDPKKSSLYRYAQIIARSTTIDLIKHVSRQKRGNGVNDISLDELAEKEIL